MANGMWVLHDDGRFELQEPYKTMLCEAKTVATMAWYEALIGYLEPRCPYDAPELSEKASIHITVSKTGRLMPNKIPRSVRHLDYRS